MQFIERKIEVHLPTSEIVDHFELPDLHPTPRCFVHYKLKIIQPDDTTLNVLKFIERNVESYSLDTYRSSTFRSESLQLRVMSPSLHP